MKIKVLIVDDHGVVRQGLRMFLSLDAELEIVGEASNGIEAIQKAKELTPDVILIDLLMPEMDGVIAIEQIKSEHPDIELIALTSSMDPQLIIEAIRAGASGYLLKDTEAENLCKSIKAAVDGEVQLSPQVAAQLIQDIKEPNEPVKLTDKEYETLRLLANGLSNRAIAEQLVVSQKTVKAHISNILKKMQVNSRTQAILYAIKNRLISINEIHL